MATLKSKDAWAILKQEFEGSAKVISIKLETLWKEFDNIQTNDILSIKEFFQQSNFYD